MRDGEDVRLPHHRDDPPHLLLQVYTEMLLQVCSDYPALPDPRALKLRQILFFYNGRRGSLKKFTTSKPKQKAPTQFRRYR